ncbi:MAG: hypothetical protein HFF08_07250 [Oscillospiraceae bacterium]|nr:hypothetical protein [Oscillospiraceae bacterium]
MGEMNGSAGINQLARTLQERMCEVSQKPPALDFGTIGADMSLLLSNFPKPIPQGEYLVCRQLTLGAVSTHLTYTIGAGNVGDGTHNHGDSGTHGGHVGGSGSHAHTAEGPHVHDVLIPEKMRSIKPGDRVLAVTVGNDVCVVDIILPASVIA